MKLSCTDIQNLSFKVESEVRCMLLVVLLTVQSK